MNLFNIAAALTLNSDDYEKGLTNAEKKTSGFKDAVSKGFKAVGTGVAAVGAAATALGVSFYKGVGETAEYGDSIDKMSQKIGLTAEAYQEWDFILQHSGSSISALQPVMKNLTKNAQANADAFEALGISQKDVAEMSREELFEATITALQNVSDEQERAELATKALGRSAAELGPLLNTSAEDTEAMKKQVHDLGGVMSNDGVKNAAKYQDSLQNLQTATTGLKRNLMAEFMPAISTVFDGLADIFSGNSDSGIKQITDGVTELSNTLLEKIPELVPVVTSIMIAIGTAIIENAPMLLESALLLLDQLTTAVIDNLPLILGVVLTIIEQIATKIGEDLPVLLPAIIQAMLSIADMLIERLPDLLSALLVIVQGLADGIIKSLPIIIDALPKIITGVVNFLLSSIPQIIQTGISLLTSLVGALPEIIQAIVKALPQIISGIINALLDNLPLIIQAGFDLITALVGALPEIILEIVKAIPQIITGIVEALGKGWEKVKEVGKNLIRGLWQGIKDMGQWIKDQIKNFAGGIVDGIKNFFGIHSPSTVFRDVIGKNLVAGLGDGIDRYADIALNKMYGLADDILDAATIEPTVRMNGISELGGASASREGVQITQNIYAERMTPSEVFEEAREQQERWLLLGV